MGIYVCEIFTECDDLTSPEFYAQECLGFIPNEVVHFRTDDSTTLPVCQFKDDKTGLQKVYERKGSDLWVRIMFPPSIVPCVEPEIPPRPRPDEPPPVEPIDERETIQIPRTLEKIEQWQRDSRVRFTTTLRRGKEAELRSLASMDAQRIRNSLSKQRLGKRGGVGTRRINSARLSTVKDTITQIIEARRYETVAYAQRGSRVALVFTTRSGQTRIVTGNGYRQLLRELALGRR